MQRMAILLAGLAAVFGSGAATAAAPPDFLPKIRCLAAFEAAVATLEPDVDPNERGPDARDRDTRGSDGRQRDTRQDPPGLVELRQRIDDIGERFASEVESAPGLTDRDRDAGDRAYQEEAER